MIGLVVGGVASGVGKTTLTLGLIGALRRRGLSVQPFKVGPDYIDPSQHTQAAGRPSRNLDSWLVPEPQLRELFWRAARHADAALVEGVMGLFDGRTGDGEAGSTAQVAKILGLPVLLVVDAAKAARSVAATVLGCQALDPQLSIIGVVLNNVAGARHAAIGREAIESLTHTPVLGWLRRDDTLRQQERYLGLVPASERRLSAGLLEAASARVEQHIDLDRLLKLASHELRTPPASGIHPTTPPGSRVRIAVARDAAFNFYYQDSLDLLEAWGAELVPFSPLQDAALPAATGAVYLGGGFPEVFAAELAANRPMLTAIRAAASAGLPVYAECGGLMYLQDWLTDADGHRHQLAGVLPGASTLVGTRLTLGYRAARARRSTLISEAGGAVRGHEFHWSYTDPPSGDHAAYDLHTDPPRQEGYAVGSVLASYLHVHFASNVAFAPRFVDAACRSRRHHMPNGLRFETVSLPLSLSTGASATPVAGPDILPTSRIIPPHDLEGMTMPENDARQPARAADVGGAHFGLSELMYAHTSDLISRPEIRAISLSKLRLRPGSVLWDIGAASGALAIEAAGLIPRLTVHAVERSDEQIKQLLRNIGARTTANRVRVVPGEAPDILSTLPDPDAIFLGTGGGRLTEILTECAARLKPNGRIVCNIYTIESLADAVRWAESRGLPAEVVQVNIARSVDVVGMTRLSGESPVSVVTISP